MDKFIAIAAIDELNKSLIDPAKMLKFIWIRVIINQIPEKDWEKYSFQAEEILSK